MIRAVAALGAVTLAALACTVSRRTDKLACSTTADCGSGRACSAGYCVTDAPIDAPGCPSECTACDDATGTCNITGSGAAITCPAGWSCVLACSTTTPCGPITCGTSDCDVTCIGTGACADLTCGMGKCNQDCEGSGACGATACASSCRCDVTCNPMVGACGTMTCPVKGNKSCTLNMIPGLSCDSSVAPPCHSC